MSFNKNQFNYHFYYMLQYALNQYMVSNTSFALPYVVLLQREAEIFIYNSFYKHLLLRDVNFLTYHFFPMMLCNMY